MRIESSQLLNKELPEQKVIKLINTFEQGLKELAGMMSFLVPKVSGITFIGPENKPLALIDPSLGQCNDSGCTILKETLISYKGNIVFDQAPTKALPYILR